MDLKLLSQEPLPAEAAAIDAAIALPKEEAGETFSLQKSRERRHLLLPALWAAQRRAGWVSPGALGYIARRLHVPPAEAYGVATFYGLFSLERRPATVLHVCEDLACRSRGSSKLMEELRARLGPEGVARRGALWLKSPCLGLCEKAPAALVTQAGETPVEAGIAPASIDALERLAKGEAPPGMQPFAPLQPREELKLLRRVGLVDPASIEDYRAHGGYTALLRAFELGPAKVISELSASKLVGRGGAAFPTGRKWTAVASQPATPRYLVCNADESEPGTFKDRVLMEEDPFALIEAMTLAAFATGCEKGFLYVRGEYPLAIERLENAIKGARAEGLLGSNVLGKGLCFDLELRRGAGAYVCGEETALFNSIEGLRGEPRSKPPFPVEAGLFGKPTLINNVETLVSVLTIISEGAQAWAGLGMGGNKLFCISGHVERPGVYELPLGTPLSKLLELAGGVAGGKKLKAVLLGGASGAFVTPSEIDVPLTFEDTRKIGATLGSGAVVVFDEETNLIEVLQRAAEFFRDESCGQCVPCRVGTVRVEELLARAARRAPLGSFEKERALLTELGQAMRDASICGLGQTASSALESAVAKLGVLS